jgi:hypothetical protein
MFRRCAAETSITSDRRSHRGTSKKAFDVGHATIILGGRPMFSLESRFVFNFILSALANEIQLPL